MVGDRMYIQRKFSTQKSLEFLLGFKLTAFRSFALLLCSVASLLTRDAEIVLADPTGVLIGLAVASVAASTAGAVMASDAAEDATEAGEEAGILASTMSGDERVFQREVNNMMSGVDRAEVEGQISSAATPIAGTTLRGMQDVDSMALATEGGGGAPISRFTGRSAALKRQLAEAGSKGVAEAATGARKVAEDAATSRQQTKLTAHRDLASLGRQRRMARLQGDLAGMQTAASLRGASIQNIGGMGSAIAGGVAGGMGYAAGQSMMG